MGADTLGSMRDLNMTQALYNVIVHPVTEAQAFTGIIS